jgi:hypothetical protein
MTRSMQGKRRVRPGVWGSAIQGQAQWHHPRRILALAVNGRVTIEKSGAPERIRTSNLLIRSQML